MRWALADDGERIPVTVVHRSGLVARGDVPLLVECYGAYGACLQAEYKAECLPLLRRGWVLALAHVRGGGELGPLWHAGGRGLRKRRSVDDLECVIRALHGWGYSRPELSSAIATSAGGLVLGALLNRAPGLLGAALMQSPFLDPLGAMLDPSLPLTLEERGEWGDPGVDPRVRAAMEGYSPYETLPKHAAPLPPLLIRVARNDPRVPCTQALRYVSRARHRARQDVGTPVTEEGGPLLLRIQSVAGHHRDGGRFRRLEAHALDWAFLMNALGVEVSATPL